VPTKRYAKIKVSQDLPGVLSDSLFLTFNFYE